MSDVLMMADEKIPARIPAEAHRSEGTRMRKLDQSHWPTGRRLRQPQASKAMRSAAESGEGAFLRIACCWRMMGWQSYQSEPVIPIILQRVGVNT